MRTLEHAGVGVYLSTPLVKSYYHSVTLLGVLNVLVWTTFFIAWPSRPARHAGYEGVLSLVGESKLGRSCSTSTGLGRLTAPLPLANSLSSRRSRLAITLHMPRS